jgi:glycosyltransferase involved in cell wall biosynthesis
MMMHPLISVIVPVYNHEKFIGETIKSVIDQTYQNLEMLIVDDCSTDKSWDIIQEWSKKDSRIKTFRNDQNKGLVENWRFLIDQSKGEYIAFLEGDDVFYSENLEKKVAIFKEYSNLGMVYCNFKIIDENGKVLISDNHKKIKVKSFKNEIIAPEVFLFSKSAPLSTYSQITIRRNIVTTIGYPRDFGCQEKVFLPSDWDFNFRIATRSYVYALDDTLMGYRRHSNNNSSKTTQVSNHLRITLNHYICELSENERALEGVRYMMGKTFYFNAIYYVENGMKSKAWREFLLYAIKYPKNIRHDFILSIKLFLRLLLPNRLNAYLKNRYYGG